MAIEFVAPSFIQESDPDIIQQRMMKQLPADIDNMPGGFPWDFTMPTAMEKSQLIQFHLLQTLKLMFPMWAWGDWLDYHAMAVGIKRKEAGYATGRLQIKGIAKTVIPKGTVFATLATTKSSSIEFITTEEHLIGNKGEVEIAIKALEPGTLANVKAGTIVLMARPIKGIQEITNQDDITGGTAIEDDTSLRTRIQEINTSTSTSFVGNNNDYIRWAKEIVGVGNVMIIPEWNGPGTVKIILVDTNGKPANEEILEKVRNHILSPKEPMNRLAPIGASVQVSAPELLELTYQCKVILREKAVKETIIQEISQRIGEYYKEARVEGILKYNKVVAILAQIEDIRDFGGLTINGEVSNIIIEAEVYPETKAIMIEEGSL